MKKLFISLPMKDLDDATIIESMQLTKERVERQLGCEVELIDSLIKEELPTPVDFLAKSISMIAQADIITFANKWAQARGCVIEYIIAKTYNKEIVILDEEYANTSLPVVFPMIMSSDYRDRMYGEYQELKIRKEKLEAVLQQYHDGTINFTCPFELLSLQRDIMDDLLDILSERARLEEVNIDIAPINKEYPNS